jgi:hypothetical protein
MSGSARLWAGGAAPFQQSETSIADLLNDPEVATIQHPQGLLRRNSLYGEFVPETGRTKGIGAQPGIGVDSMLQRWMARLYGGGIMQT